MAETLKRLNPGIRPLRYVLNMAIDPDQAEFSASCEIEIACDAAHDHIELHGLGFEFDSVQLLQPNEPPRSGKVEVLEQGLLAVSFNRPLLAGSNHLRFAYRTPFAKGLEGLYRARNGLTWGVFSQLQALGARRVFPCFDEPAFKAIFAVTLRVPDTCEAFSNSAETSRSDDGEGTLTIRFAPTLPISTYLMAFAVGQFDIVQHVPVPAGQIERDPLPLRGIARRGEGKNLATALQWTGSIVQAMEAYFGMAFPFPKLDFLAVPDFAAGGMENAGLIMYEESLILLDDESNFEQYRDVLTTHAHEIAHHWVGNLASPAWWDDLWLNESFATFMEAKVSHQLQPLWGYDTDLQETAVDAMELDLLPSVPRIHRPIVTQDEITTAFDAITYQKGAVALAMLESEMGPEPFQKAVQKLLQENRFGTYSTGKFLSVFDVKAIPRNSGRSFSSLINETGVPERYDVTFITHGEPHASYFRARFKAKQWQEVFKAVPTLTKTEGLRAAISLDLALLTLELSTAEYMAGVKAFANHPNWKVAGHALNRISFLIAELAQPAGIRRQAGEIYAPLFNSLGYAPRETDEDFVDWEFITRREDLALFFAGSDADPAAELDLLFFGLRLLDAPDQMFEVEWLPDELVESALTAVIRTKRDDVADILIEVLRSTDTSWQRDKLLNVLAIDTSPGTDARMRSLFANEYIKGQEIGSYLSARAGIPALREGLLDFLSTAAPSLLARLGGDADIGIITFANAYTSEKQAQRLEAIIKPILGTIQGGEPELRLVLERIRLNARLLEHLEHRI